MRSLTIGVLALVPGCKQIFGIEEPMIVRADAREIDAAIGCTDDLVCPPAAPRCAIAQGYCVDCLTNADCIDAATPLCSSDTLTCRGCLKHTDCASAACLSDGTCGTDTNVLYVAASNGVDNLSCGFDAPCATVVHALSLATAARNHVKLSGALVNPSRITFELSDIVWLADPGTTMTASEAPIVEIKSGRLEINDVDFSCTNGDRALRVQDGALYVRRVRIGGCSKLAIEGSGGLLVIDRTVIEDNPGGGIETGSTSFSITNSFFTRNGDNGAVVIEAAAAGQNRFEFNTVVDNMANTGSTAGKTGGVECPNANTMSAPYNIIARNTGYRANTFGGCDFSKSIILPDVASLMFASPDALPYDYHLTAQSVAIDAAAESTLTSDIDSDPRPQGAESDIGADEFTP